MVHDMIDYFYLDMTWHTSLSNNQIFMAFPARQGFGFQYTEWSTSMSRTAPRNCFAIRAPVIGHLRAWKTNVLMP